MLFVEFSISVKMARALFNIFVHTLLCTKSIFCRFFLFFKGLHFVAKGCKNSWSRIIFLTEFFSFYSYTFHPYFNQGGKVGGMWEIALHGCPYTHLLDTDFYIKMCEYLY